MPRCTVIVPCFNYGHLLGETLDSVLCQTEPDWECLVVDDGSTDDTGEVVGRYARNDARFKYIYQNNKGLSAARNTGLRAAQGEFLQFLDADDLIQQRKLELQSQFLSKNPDIDITFGEMRYFRTGSPDQLFLSIDGKNEPLTKRVVGAGCDVLSFLLVDNIMVVNSPLLRKRVAESAGYFDETLKALEDWEYWLRCGLRGIRFSYHDSPNSLALVRVHSNSMSSNRQLMLSANLRIRRELASKIGDPVLSRLNRRGIVNAEVAMAMTKMKAGNIRSGLTGLLNLLRR